MRLLSSTEQLQRFLRLAAHSQYPAWVRQVRFTRAGLKGLGAVAAAGAGGAIEGAIAGYGSGEGGNRADRAWDGAQLGALTAGTFRAVSPLVTSVARRTYDGLFANNRIRAGETLQRALDADGDTAARLAVRLNKAKEINPETRMIDVAGPHMKSLAGEIREQGGKPATEMFEFASNRITERRDRAFKRLAGDMGADFKDIAQTRAQLDVKRKTAAEPFYAKAYQYPIETNRVAVKMFNDIKETPIGKEAIENASKSLRSGEFDKLPLMEQIDLMQAEMYKLASEMGDRPALRVRKLLRARRKYDAPDELMDEPGLLDVVEGANENYAKARSIYSDESNMLDALEKGEKIFDLKPDEVRLAYTNMTNAEKEVFRDSAFMAFVAKSGDVNDKASLIELMGNKNIREKFGTFMSEKQRATLEDWVNSEREMFEFASKIKDQKVNSLVEYNTAAAVRAGKFLDAVTTFAATSTRGIRRLAIPAIKGLTEQQKGKASHWRRRAFSWRASG